MNAQEEEALLTRLAHGMLLVSIPTFLILYLGVDAPWGKHLSTSRSWLGPLIPNPRLCWLIFESPNLIWAAYCITHLNKKLPTANAVLLVMFVLHYLHRDLVYPYLMSAKSQPMPLGVVVSALAFCTVNGYLQCQSLCRYQKFPEGYTKSWQFIVGTSLFVVGMCINIHSDAILRRLRKLGGGYQIPRGGMFEYVSGANHLGEVLEWFGFVVANDFSLPSIAFFVYTCSNLVPRAISSHQFYLEKFKDYPRQRKAILPFIW